MGDNMNYLFFDEESIDKLQKRACSFGYVLTDENFNVIKKENLFFNPELEKIRWDRHVINKIVKIDPQYIASLKQTFKTRYKKIKSLMSEENTICIGFAVANDIRYLLNMCLDYKLPCINFKYLDLERVAKEITNKPVESLSKEYIKWCNASPENAHNSLQDAIMTMEITKSICSKLNINLRDFTSNHPNDIGIVKDFCYGYNTLSDIRQSKQTTLATAVNKPGHENWIEKNSKNNLLFIKYLDYLKRQKPTKNTLENKKISISLNYEMYNFQNMLKLASLISDAGGAYVKKPTMANIFVTYDKIYDHRGKQINCSKLRQVTKANNDGDNIEIITFDAFLSKLNIDRQKLDNLEQININFLPE